MPREMEMQGCEGTGNVVYWKPVKQNTLRIGFCDVELCKQVEKEGICKMPSRFSDENNSGGLKEIFE